MLKLPINYCNIVIGLARVDDDLTILQEVKILCRVTNRIRTIGDRRADAIAAILREDLLLRQTIKPFFYVCGRVLYLAHFCISKDVEEAATILLDDPHDLTQRQKLERARKKILRVVYVNEDRTDCRRSNLRMVERGEIVEP